MKNKRAQVTIFIIIAIVIVVGVALFFAIRGGLFSARVPASLKPAYTTFLSCLEEDTEAGISILESQGGYIKLPEFEPGSEYAPFSSQLNFLGNPIPYWYYISGNGAEKQQIPTKTEMENQLQEFVEKKIRACSLETYYDEGIEIELATPSASAVIKNSEVILKLGMRMTLQKGDDSAVVNQHKISVNSQLGTLYNSAKKVYDKEQKDLFLEEYAVDTLRTYAPVDGVEITCAPLTWEANNVFNDLQEAIEMNTLAMNMNKEKYFDLGNVDEDVRFITSTTWPSIFEVSPSDDSLMISYPVGNQEGLGILGFCYVPYHFVYNLGYPVLVQIEKNNEIFQFPMAVVLRGNNPRESLTASAVQSEDNICKYRDALITINTYDSELDSVDANIFYECSGEKCYIGETTQGTLTAEFPKCINGHVIATAEGFEEASYLYSSVNGGSASIVLDELHDLNVELRLDGNAYAGDAIVYFVSDETSATVSYPEQTSVEIGEGNYEIQVYIYNDASINLGASTTEQCYEVVRGGIGGVLGLTEEKCFEIEFPAQVVSRALAGGGKGEYFLTNSQLGSSNKIVINSESLPLPNSVEQIQDNALLFENKEVEVNLV